MHQLDQLKIGICQRISTYAFSCPLGFGADISAGREISREPAEDPNFTAEGLARKVREVLDTRGASVKAP